MGNISFKLPKFTKSDDPKDPNSDYFLRNFWFWTLCVAVIGLAIYFIFFHKKKGMGGMYTTWGDAGGNAFPKVDEYVDFLEGMEGGSVGAVMPTESSYDPSVGMY